MKQLIAIVLLGISASVTAWGHTMTSSWSSPFYIHLSASEANDVWNEYWTGYNNCNGDEGCLWAYLDIWFTFHWNAAQSADQQMSMTYGPDWLAGCTSPKWNVGMCQSAYAQDFFHALAFADEMSEIVGL